MKDDGHGHGGHRELQAGVECSRACMRMCHVPNQPHMRFMLYKI